MNEDQYIILELRKVYENPIFPIGAWRFSTAEKVGVFMLGRVTGRFLIYKNSHLADRCHFYANIASLTKYLDELEVE